MLSRQFAMFTQKKQDGEKDAVSFYLLKQLVHLIEAKKKPLQRKWFYLLIY